MIGSTQITNTQILTFMVVLVFSSCIKLFSRKVLFIKTKKTIEIVTNVIKKRFMVKPHIRVTYRWHTSTYEYIQMTCKYIRMTYEWYTNDIRVHTSGIRVKYEWHTSTYEWYTDDIQVHTDGIKVHMSDIRMTYVCIREAYGWHTSTYEWHTDGMRGTHEWDTNDKRVT